MKNKPFVRVLRGLLFLLLMVCTLAVGPAPVLAKTQLPILCYHEIDRPGDYFAVSRENFLRQVEYLKAQQYHFVTLDEYIAYTQGKRILPEKSVMLTFDDGYASFYTKVYPILKREHIPCMLAIVTSWTDGEGKPTDVRSVASWAQLREMEQSGLVTVVSHTHAMHKQRAMAPLGGASGIAANHLYQQGHYETEAAYEKRLDDDMRETQRLFELHLGHPSKAIVWPYGMYSGASIRAAEKHGMAASFLLDGGINEAEPKYETYARRMIMGSDVTVKGLSSLLTKDHAAWDSRPIRMVQLDIDPLYNKDARAFRQNIAWTVRELKDNHISLVALQAFADPDGDGNYQQVYFYNQEVPVAADAFNDVCNALQQAGIKVVAWMPALTCQAFFAKDGSNLVRAESPDKAGWYARISPFDEASLQKAAALFRDLGRYTPAEGILFQDDLYLNDFEDVSAPARAAYQKAYGKDLGTLSRTDPKAMRQWTELKTRQLDHVADVCLSSFRESRPEGLAMRDIYAEAVTNPASQEWFAQSYPDYLTRYDYTVVMAYPYMDKEKHPDEALRKTAKAIQKAGGEKRTIVKVQTYDWAKEKWLSDKEVRAELNTLRKAGMRNRGVYPHSFYRWDK